jgi:hypothetical protein
MKRKTSSVLPKEKMNDTYFQKEVSPRKSLCQLSVETRIQKFSAHSTTKPLNLYPYKITAIQLSLLETRKQEDDTAGSFRNW